ncbi:hypothetical protein [Oceanithermus sp.]|uniref:hypothetical protein n=1 Tax=Oceanithermus sp. TaxID=2268145 RepID=UPI00257A67CC|nr:hypothetical protein [Oceanithermus sp.]
MRRSPLADTVRRARAELEACIEREELAYGPDYYLDVARMAAEGPAPDPCLERFNELVAAVRAYRADGGALSDLDLGEHARAVRAALEGEPPA